jgi:ABC-type multidrug transport system fused ATPase/permease subunit
MIGVAFASPIVAVMVLISLVFALATLALAVGGAAVMWRTFVVRAGLSGWGDAAVMTAIWFGVTGAAWRATRSLVRSTREMIVDVVDEAREAARGTREVLAERAERERVREAQGGMISMSAADGAEGGLTQSARAGLEAVEQGVELDLDEASGEDDRVERAQESEVDVS